MVSAILTSVIDEAADKGESNIAKKLKLKKQVENAAKNKALQQAKKDQEKAAIEKAVKEEREIEALLAEKMRDRLEVQEAFSAVQTAQHQIVRQVDTPEQFIMNRKNVVAITIDPEKKKIQRLVHFNELRNAGFAGAELKSEMAQYDEYLRTFETTTVSDFFIDFQKLLKPCTLNDVGSWQYFLQTMDGLKNNACDLDINEDEKAILRGKITELFTVLYPQYGHYNADLVEVHINNQEQILKSCKQSLDVCNQAFNQTQDVKKRLLIDNDIKKLEEHKAQASLLLGEAVKAQNMFYMMAKLRKMQLVGGVFQQQIELSPLIDVREFVIDKFYEKESCWVEQFKMYQNFICNVIEKKSYVECPDYQAIFAEQYKRINVPADDIELAVFDSAYSILNMLENKIDFNSEIDVQNKLFAYFHHTYPTYSLELIGDMTKTQMMLFVIMKKIAGI